MRNVLSNLSTGPRTLSRVAGVTVCALAGVMLMAGSASADSPQAQVRFVHAVPGVGAAQLSVGGTTVGRAGFGEATDFAFVPAGNQQAALAVPGVGTLKSQVDLEDGGAYTIVAMPKGKSAQLKLFADGSPTAGKARLRLIHASAELGSPDAELNGKTVAHMLKYGAATPYWTVSPGTYELEVQDPKTGDDVMDAQHAALSAGTSWTGVVLGGGGEKARTLLLSDLVSAPTAAPQSGFGGLIPDQGPPWLLAALAALFAGGLGRLTHQALSSRGGSEPRL
jgi:Domain of unknown function (DUF4397)